MSDQLGMERPTSMQNQYNLAYREEEREMIPLCQDQQIAITPWSPLAGGFLTGVYKRNHRPHTARFHQTKMKRRYFRPEDFDVVERVEEIAREKGVPPAKIALACLFHKDYVTAPIVGIENIEYVQNAVDVLEIKLNSADMKRLEEVYRPHSPEWQGHDEVGQLR